MRIKELNIGLEVEKQELSIQQESIKNLAIFGEIETRKIDHELKIESYKNEKEKELQQKIETSELNVQKEIESLRIATEIGIQLKKIEHDTTFINTNKVFQELQAIVHQQVEKAEITANIAIIGEEQKRLETELDRANAEEALTTAIEKAIAERHKLTAEIAAQAVEDEAKTIKLLAEAEGIRYHSIPVTDADRNDKLIRELVPKLIENLPQLAEVVKALAPQPGILGESNVYTFPNGNGEDMNKLMFSTSGMLLLESMLNGKLGHLLEQYLHTLKK